MISHDTCPSCPFRVEKYDPGYHTDDTYECELVITDLRDNTVWRISVSLEDFWAGNQQVVIDNLLR